MDFVFPQGMEDLYDSKWVEGYEKVYAAAVHGARVMLLRFTRYKLLLALL